MSMTLEEVAAEGVRVGFYPSSPDQQAVKAFRLGHRSTRMIEQHYERLIESMDADIAERLDRTRTNAGPEADQTRPRKQEAPGVGR